ncbi:MAG: oxidative damage protection protein [Proteobacteria bacterium]|nr:oxidative damage protection protein [Pseudomonadota bacterium]
MAKMIFCVKLKEEQEALDEAPFPGSMGEKILNQVSKQAWRMWLAHQTMLINEYRLSLIDSKSREFLNQEMQKYLFGEGSDAPAGFTPQE